MVSLQVCIDVLKVEPGSCGETYDGNHFVSIKVEGDTDKEDEDDPLLITSPVVKAECEVSCQCVHCAGIQSWFLLLHWSNEERCAGHVCVVQMRNTYNNLVGKPERKGALVRPRHKWKKNIKFVLKRKRI